MRVKRRLAGWMVALLTLAASPVFAQQVDIKAAPPEGQEHRPEIVPPGLHYEITRPDDADFYPDGPRVRHDPAFIEPFVAKVETPNGTGEVGLSGWTAPAPPVGPSVIRREVNGWLSFGLSFVWGGPPTPPKRAQR